MLHRGILGGYGEWLCGIYSRTKARDRPEIYHDMRCLYEWSTGQVRLGSPSCENKSSKYTDKSSVGKSQTPFAVVVTNTWPDFGTVNPDSSVNTDHVYASCNNEIKDEADADLQCDVKEVRQKVIRIAARQGNVFTGVCLYDTPRGGGVHRDRDRYPPPPTGAPDCPPPYRTHHTGDHIQISSHRDTLPYSLTIEGRLQINSP